MRGLPDEDTQDGVSPLADVEKLVIEGRYGRADLALRRLEALIPSLAPAADTETLLLALYGRALLLRQEGATTQNALAACDVLERAAHEREAELWVATACATRARFRVDSGDIGGATADLARADAEAATGDLTNDTGYRLLDALALVYAGLRLHDRADEVRTKIDHSITQRRVLDQAQHWSTWSGELAARAMEPLAGGAPDPEHELMGRAIEIAAKLDRLPEAEVPSTLRRGARGVRALSAAYRGRPSEALRLLGPDAFGTVGDLPLVERQIVSLAAMRAHALVGSLATARSLDDAATTPPATLPNLVLEVCRTRERLWLETYAGGDVIPVLQRMTELLVRLGWRGMDLVADTARQALEHQALRTESRTDALTGVGNRRALDEELRQLLRFGPLPLALILVDVDHFKGVNDVFTHVVGDEVLRRVATSLSLQLRTDDQLLRYGGDEFVVLLPGTGDEEADAIAERMRATVSDQPWTELAENLQVSVTTGVAAVWSLSGRRPDADAEKLFRRADERLLEGKRSRPEVSRSHQRPASPTGPTSDPTPSTEITVVLGGETELSERTTADRAGLAITERAGLAAAGRPNPPADRPRIATERRDPATEHPDLAPDRSDSSEVRIADAARLAAVVTDEALADHEWLTADTTGLPVTRRPLRAGPPAAGPVGGPTSSFSVPDFSSPDGDSIEDDLDEDEPELPAAGSTPARARNTSRASMPSQSPDRHSRSVFDPDPDVDLDESPVGMSPRPSGRRDGRPRTVQSDDSRRNGVNPLAPMRSRREARAAGRPDPDSRPETSASRDAAEADAAAREVAKAQADDARTRAAREARARDDAARDAEVRAQAEHEKAVRAAELRDRTAREKAAREAAEAAEVATRAKMAREKVKQEQAAREAAETAAREAAEAAAREAEARAEQERRRAAERARVERERRKAEAREQEVREAKARAEQARRVAEAREQERRDAEARKQAAREKAAREQAEQEQAAREAAEAAAARKAAEEREAAEAERRRAAERARVEQERRRAEQERRQAEAREKQRREEEARAEQERRAAKAEQERLEAAARARAERELMERQRVEQERQARERREAERREAEAREAEQQRQEARTRAEAEARTAAVERARVRAEAEAERSRAADRIREEAYARAAEQARRAAVNAYQPPGRTGSPSYETAAHESTAPAAATSHPLQRRAPLYDANWQQPEEDSSEPFRERRSHPRPGSQPRAEDSSQSGVGTNGHGHNGAGQHGSTAKGKNGQGQNSHAEPPEADPESMETTQIRTRREPFGPVTRSQAIIDLSARKRPRSPYSS